MTDFVNWFFDIISDTISLFWNMQLYGNITIGTLLVFAFGFWILAHLIKGKE